MRIVVTGRDGQLVRSLQERVSGTAAVEVIAVGRPQLDLANSDTVGPAILAARPDLVVSAAAYTAVDQAEAEPVLAAAINGAGAGAVAAAAASAGVPVIHISTDYVFSGDLDRPYVETDPPDPRNVYGRTKLAGEHAVAAANTRHFILRTSWLYSPFGKNFARTMLRLAAERDVIRVVADQIGNPTSALDLADAVLAVAGRVQDGGEGDHGIYHIAGTGDASWAEFAAHLMDVSAAAGGPFARIEAIETADYPTIASRPANSRLATGRALSVFGWRSPHWQESSRNVVERLLRP